MTSPLGKLITVLGLDARGFTSGLQSANKETQAFGMNAQTGMKLASVGAALAFAGMSKGAAEMERAQGNFQAATGRSREEAIAFSKDMNSLVGTAATVGRTFDEIASAGTQIAQQFGLTGEANKRLTEDFLAFSKVTRQDAAGAVNDFDAALDAWGEPAERATGLMDQLVASNQRFGTEAGPASVDALTKMAPALRSMGAGLDDGVALLNLFEAAGLDAAKAPPALNKAMQTLKPGQSLDDLIAQIASIEDPLERGQKAAEIFGMRSGVGMATAIQPGMTSLEEFGISANEAAGAADQAAENMLTTSDKIKMYAERVGGFLRGIGAEFGPLVTGMASVVSLLGPSLGKAWTAVRNSGPMKRAAALAGAAASAAYSGAMKVADALIGAVSTAWSVVRNSRGVKMAAGLAGAAAAAAYAGALKVGDVVAAGLSAMWAMLPGKGAVKSGINAAGKVMGGMLGKALILGAAIALIAMIPELWGQMVAAWDKARASAGAVDTATQAFLGDPKTTRAQVEAQLAELRVLPEQLDPVKRAIFELRGFALGVDPKQIWQDQITAMEQWLAANGDAPGAVLAVSVREGFGRGMGGSWAADGMTGWMDAPAVADAAAVAGGNVGGAFATAVMATEQRAREAYINAWGRSLQSAIDGHIGAVAFAAGVAIDAGVGRGIAEGTHELASGMDELRWVLENGLTPEQQVKEIGAKWVATFREGIHSEIPGAREAAQNVGIEALQALSQVSIGTNEAKRIGQIVDELYASGLTANQIIAGLAAQGVGREALLQLAAVKGWSTAAVDDALQYVHGMEGQQGAAGAGGRTLGGAARDGILSLPWGSYGVKAGVLFGRGLDGPTALRTIRRHAANAAAEAAGALYQESPARFGPFSEGGGTMGWGEKAGILFGRGMDRSRGFIRRHAIALARAAAFSAEPGFSPRQLAATGVTSAVAIRGARGDGDLHLHFHGPIFGGPAGLDELVRQIRQRVRQTQRGSGGMAQAF